MKVTRIMANVATDDLGKAQAFYGDLLGLDRIMDHGWFQTYGSAETMTVQLSFGSQGGSGTAVPDLSIEVDDLDEALKRMQQAGVPVAYGTGRWPCGGGRASGGSGWRGRGFRGGRPRSLRHRRGRWVSGGAWAAPHFPQGP